ncbi:MAG: helix-turn-helix transcriptional regulator, partial [Bacteroidota bacterium]
EKMKEIKQVAFINKTVPDSHFDLVKIEELLQRDMDHEPSKLHRVNFHVLMIITAGQGYHTIDFTDYKYHKGVVLTIRKDQVHKFFRTGDTKGFLVVFTEDFILNFLKDNDAQKSLQLFNEALGSPKVELDESGFNDITQLVKHLEYEYLHVRDTYTTGLLRSTLHILITKIYRFKSHEETSVLTKKYLQDFLEFQELVEKRCFQTKKVMDYAQELGFSTKKLNMVVQSIVQKPAKVFIDEILMLKIKRLLINSQLSIKEIAYMAGFDEPSNLFKFFKRYNQSTPENFRQAYL